MQSRGKWVTRAILGLMAVAAVPQGTADVPGVVINEIPSPSWLEIIFSREPLYTSDPCILVLENGDYLASHSRFNPSSSIVSDGPTEVFLSQDKGESWTKIGDLSGVRATLFEHNGAVYALGASQDASPSHKVLHRSMDLGENWEQLDFSYGGMATPDNLTPFAGRLWLATTRNSLSMAEDDDPFSEASWTLQGGFPGAQDDWLPGTGFTAADNFIGEGQITASPQLGLAILPKVRLLPYIAVASVDAVNGRVAFDPAHDFVRMEGGEKKFGVRYDAVSGKYYMLCNPILPAHYGSSLAIDLIRNTAALRTSRDLRNWRTEQIFLYSSHISYEGFQYFNFDFDGEDLVIASRTAFDMGGNRPPRGHDSNLLTFHRIPDFRAAQRQHLLRLEGGEVRRFEITQHTDAPLGRFALGNSFAGSPLSDPVAMGEAEGRVYIEEAGGRILQFDLSGNFLAVVGNAPVSLSGGEQMISNPVAGTCVWQGAGSGEWDDPRKWVYWNRPGTDEDVAVFGSAGTSAVTVDVPNRNRQWRFDQDGDFQGWDTVNVDSAQVVNGVLRGVASNHDPQVRQIRQNFRGSEVPEVRVRMRAETEGEVPVDFYWRTTAVNSFAEARKVRATYTGNGAFQELVFPVAGHGGWEGRQIDRIRIDPLNGDEFAGVLFEIESVDLFRVPTRVKGLWFQNNHPYTLAGEGWIELEADEGSSGVDVVLGDHVVDVPVSLASDAEFRSAPGTSLRFSGGLDLAGNTLGLSGEGFSVTNQPFSLNGGTLVLEEGSTLSVDRQVLDFNATLKYRAPEHVAPKAGDTVRLLEFDGELDGEFQQVILQELREGLGWDMDELYTAGTVTIVRRIPVSWLEKHHLPTDGSADFEDTDGDGMDNYSEWKAGTDPNDPNSFFSVEPVTEPEYQLRWHSLPNRLYEVQRSTNLLASPPFQSLESGIPGINGMLEWSDGVPLPAAFYRVRITME